VPLPFVHHNAPIYLAGLARPGPTERDNRAVHAFARLGLHGRIDHIQCSWVKLGDQVAADILRGGADDMGGTLMEETISRMAGSENGSARSVTELAAIAALAGRPVPPADDHLRRLADPADPRPTSAPRLLPSPPRSRRRHGAGSGQARARHGAGRARHGAGGPQACASRGFRQGESRILFRASRGFRQRRRDGSNRGGMAMLGELFPGKKLSDEGGEDSDGKLHRPRFDIDLDSGVVRCPAWPPRSRRRPRRSRGRRRRAATTSPEPARLDQVRGYRPKRALAFRWPIFSRSVG